MTGDVQLFMFSIENRAFSPRWARIFMLLSCHHNVVIQIYIPFFLLLLLFLFLSSLMQFSIKKSNLFSFYFGKYFWLKACVHGEIPLGLY